MQGKARIKQYKTMQGGDEDPILRPRPAPPHCHLYTHKTKQKTYGKGHLAKEEPNNYNSV